MNPLDHSRPIGPVAWQVIDRQTGRVVGTYKIRGQARAKVDALDNAYGAYRYHMKPLY